MALVAIHQQVVYGDQTALLDYAAADWAQIKNLGPETVYLSEGYPPVSPSDPPVDRESAYPLAPGESVRMQIDLSAQGAVLAASSERSSSRLAIIAWSS